jgi:hypothetical protein
MSLFGYSSQHDELSQGGKVEIVCHLGAFDVQMSFLGSTGTLMMAWSWQSELMECCFGVDTIKYINYGKAEAHAVRAHFVVDCAMNIIHFNCKAV